MTIRPSMNSLVEASRIAREAGAEIITGVTESDPNIQTLAAFAINGRSEKYLGMIAPEVSSFV